MSTKSLFAKNILYLRKQKGLSQNEIALNLGLNRGNIASYENGSAEPSLKNFHNIVKYFNIRSDVLIEQDIEKNDEIRTHFNVRKKDQNISITKTYKEVERESVKTLQMIKGILLYINYRLESMNMVSLDYQMLHGDMVNLCEVASSLAETNIRLCREFDKVKLNKT